jgi:UDP-N-acetylglucosamine 2-epimerase (non-hydrolysing)
MKIAILVGTRPEVIKMSPIIKECQQRHIDFVLIHSNQHYSYSMDKIFFEELNLPYPKYNLEVGSGSHSNQTGNILIKLEPILEKEKPDLLLVQGDTNTVLAGAMVASKLHIKIGHIEAGLRSYDRTMPEESNRVMTDHLSSYLFAVTQTQQNILLGEGIKKSNIFVCGNTIVDSLFQNIEIATKKVEVLEKVGVKSKEYVLFTAHRASNVDTLDSLTKVIELLNSIPVKIVWPMHLRTLKQIDDSELEIPSHVKVIEPVGYLDFLNLEYNAKLIVTDSGGVQEEACILKVPCITIRSNTERPETVDVGANILVGKDIVKFKAAYHEMINRIPEWKNPFGDGSTAKTILNIITNTDVISEARPNLSISVIGLGYMGLPTASLLSAAGFPVTGVDVNENKVKAVNSGLCPFDEPGLEDLVNNAVNKHGFRAITKPIKSDVYIVAVPTPHHDGKCDLRYIEAACRDLVPVIADGNLVIIESTVRPNTCLEVVKPIFEGANKKVLIAHCPERAIPGNTLNELIYNDRIIGGSTKEAEGLAKKIYSTFVRGNIYTTNVTTAECVKLMENTFRDVNIALANEFDLVLKELGVDPWEAISLANKHPRVNILSPGPGVGGHCIAVDPWFLVESAKSAKIIKLARQINDQRPLDVVNEAISKMPKGTRKVGILGVAYKKNVDDSRESPAEHICHYLRERGFEVKAHDPFVKDWPEALSSTSDDLQEWADYLMLITDHDEYKNLKLRKPIYDTRNCINENSLYSR